MAADLYSSIHLLVKALEKAINQPLEAQP